MRMLIKKYGIYFFAGLSCIYLTTVFFCCLFMHSPISLGMGNIPTATTSYPLCHQQDSKDTSVCKCNHNVNIVQKVLSFDDNLQISFLQNQLNFVLSNEQKIPSHNSVHKSESLPPSLRHSVPL